MDRHGRTHSFPTRRSSDLRPSRTWLAVTPPMRSAKPMPGGRRVAPTWACATRSDPAFHLEMQLDAGAKAPAFFCHGSTNPTVGWVERSETHQPANLGMPMG